MEKLLETQFECSGPKVEFGFKLLKMEHIFLSILRQITTPNYSNMWRLGHCLKDHIRRNRSELLNVHRAHLLQATSRKVLSHEE